MKLVRLRNLALGLIFGAFLLMYLGVFVRSLLPAFFLVGLLMIAVSIGIYFRMGAISMRIPQVECPNCGKTTKVLGREDACMFCRTPIRIDENGEIMPS
ncbi:DUF2614 family zinc ribbon-containing protein [Effusibacillus pohliae]|uniref:DUF2614 family zinc ribbon-containing protein n=1 Tax=Effusibacillus pohliae TaxID=232270 RepID=UPI0003657310|nr:DUF2614 family zinc ribbon-containing protein [Effusibacillus pohliae]